MMREEEKRRKSLFQVLYWQLVSLSRAVNLEQVPAKYWWSWRVKMGKMDNLDPVIFQTLRYSGRMIDRFKNQNLVCLCLAKLSKEV